MSTHNTTVNGMNIDVLMQQLSVAQTVLSQAVDLLDNHLTSDEQLSVQSIFLPGSTIGKHLRHARDHFVLLAESINTPPPYILCYDTRIRNTPMETSRSCARQALVDTMKQLGEVVPDSKLNAPITLQAITPHMHEFQTTFGRELWFASLHCVHHWSMVRVIAGEMACPSPSATHLVTLRIPNISQGIKLTEDFGFAPSTLVYQGREAPLGKAKI